MWLEKIILIRQFVFHDMAAAHIFSCEVFLLVLNRICSGGMQALLQDPDRLKRLLEQNPALIGVLKSRMSG